MPKASNALKAADLIMATFDEKMVFFVSNRGVEINLYTTDKNSFDASQVDLIVDENQLLPTAIHAYNDSTSASVFLQNDGSVGANRYYTGFQAVEISEEMSADSKSELTSLASDRLLALRTSKTASEIDVKIEDAEIGDKINVSVRKFGVKATQVVSEKILKIENKNAVITFNTGG